MLKFENYHPEPIFKKIYFSKWALALFVRMIHTNRVMERFVIVGVVDHVA